MIIISKVRIDRCSVPGAWYEDHTGEVVNVFAIDSHGYWTRDTGPMRTTNWIKVEDATLLPVNASDGSP